MRDNRGRRAGSRNKGYFYRTGRGWFAKDNAGAFVPLTDEAGERLRDKDAADAIVKDAYARHRLTVKQKPVATSGVTVRDVCLFWLEKTAEVNKTRESTLERRADTIFDLCNGLPAVWREKLGKKRCRTLPDRKPLASDKIHPGYGDKKAEELTRADLLNWCAAHPVKEKADDGRSTGWSDGGRRTRTALRACCWPQIR